MAAASSSMNSVRHLWTQPTQPPRRRKRVFGFRAWYLEGIVNCADGGSLGEPPRRSRRNFLRLDQVLNVSLQGHHSSWTQTQMLMLSFAASPSFMCDIWSRRMCWATNELTLVSPVCWCASAPAGLRMLGPTVVWFTWGWHLFYMPDYQQELSLYSLTLPFLMIKTIEFAVASATSTEGVTSILNLCWVGLRVRTIRCVIS